MSKRPEQDLERFFKSVEICANGCWAWVGHRNWGGYGIFTVWDGAKQHSLAAHRWLYNAIDGGVPRHLTLDHLCRNRWCVNPDHLEVVTMRENVLRGISPNAILHKTGLCKRGHVLDPKWIRPNGRVRCRICENAYQAIWRQGRKECKA